MYPKFVANEQMLMDGWDKQDVQDGL